jgi:hypothetical protein
MGNWKEITMMKIKTTSLSQCSEKKSKIQSQRDYVSAVKLMQ